MKFIRFLGVLWFFMPCVSMAVDTSEFQNASNLLSAARRGDIQTVQVLINSGVDVNYVDSTGLSLVCTAVMNNDKRAIQILQNYGADASNCDRQIKQYKQRTKTAARGEEAGFFSGLSSTHVLALSAVGAAAVIGGVVLLAKAFDNDGGGTGSGSSGNRPNNNNSNSSSSSVKQSFAVPYGPAYLDSNGKVDTNFDLTENLSNWDTGSHATYFDYLKTSGTDNFLSDGLNSRLQNYLLMMGGYYSLATGYMGQKIFRDSSSYAPLLSETGYQKQPIKVALITGNGINPYGSAGMGEGILYASSTAQNSETMRVDKYVNNNLTKQNDEYLHTEQSGFDLSGSGSVFNTFVNVNETALAKIVAGWEAGGNPSPDLYGFIPNGQLTVYRTGNGYYWNEIATESERPLIGTFTDTDTNSKLSVNDVITIDGKSYTIKTALSQTLITNPTVIVNGTTYKLSSDLPIFIAKCDDASGCSDFAIYVGTDGAWYINRLGGNNIDAVYTLTGNQIYTYKNKVSAPYKNFIAIQSAVGTSDVIANTNILPISRNNTYTTVSTFKKEATIGNISDLKQFYSDKIVALYGENQGGIANSLFNNYSSAKPILVMPGGEYLYKDSGGTMYLSTQDVTFENYAPILYGANLNHNFMTVVAVSHDEGTSDAGSITGYGDGSAYGKLNLSVWRDSADDNANVYMSRKCGIAGVGGSGVDPWCFAASGPTSEMATASAAGAVASVKSAFDYMTNSQIFTLLALTADGPYLHTDTNGTVFTNDSLVTYLQSLYDIPGEFETESLSASEYLDLFKQVYGYGLINLQRAITPGFSVYYYDSASNNIVSSVGNKFWGNVSTNSSRASSVLSLTGRHAITTSFYDVVQSADGSMSLPRVWNVALGGNTDSKHGLYMGDVLGEFSVDSTNTHHNEIGNFAFDMAMSARAYNDNLNGLDNLHVAFKNEKYDVDAGYQRFLTDGQSRFGGRANGVLALVSDSIASGAKYKYGNFAFGGRAFSGAITDENLLENDPTVSSQFEPARLGFANGAEATAEYNNDKFVFNVAMGNLHETNTVLGAYSDGMLTMRGGNTQYVDMVGEYKMFDKLKLFARATFANTDVDEFGGIISNVSDIKSNAFALGADFGRFNFTASMPLAVVDGKVAYDSAEFNVVENDGKYEIAMNNSHVEYVDLASQKRELRFSTSYKKSLGEWTDAGLGMIYRVHPNNTDEFGNESIFMFKLHHRLGI